MAYGVRFYAVIDIDANKNGVRLSRSEKGIKLPGHTLSEAHPMAAFG